MTRLRGVALTAVAALFVLAGCSDDERRSPDPDAPVYRSNIYYYDGPSPGFAPPPSSARP
ncbi:hypothetical protein [Embleya sp. AB8]|uniref:hypothetical protein n=1 Tax=Embleya sp. AB8 TaxID=3156304 RepID=UPI003C75A365